MSELNFNLSSVSLLRRFVESWKVGKSETVSEISAKGDEVIYVKERWNRWKRH